MSGETLEQLECDVWCDPGYDSHLVSTCRDLRKKPLKAFTAEDLRILIGQGIGLPHLVPRALALLEREPLLEGDYCPGDLLMSVVRAKSLLAASPELVERLVGIVGRALPMLEDLQALTSTGADP